MLRWQRRCAAIPARGQRHGTSRGARRDIPRTMRVLVRPRPGMPPWTSAERVHSNWRGLRGSWCGLRAASDHTGLATGSSPRIAGCRVHTEPTDGGWMRKPGMCCSPDDRLVRRHSAHPPPRMCESQCGGRSAVEGVSTHAAGEYPVRVPWTEAWSKYKDPDRALLKRPHEMRV